MGRNYSIGGEVAVGNRLGKTIGFPTSNLEVDETMASPANGVYITYCAYDGKRYPSVTNVGVKPTVGSFQKNMETHIFNFDKELYGKKIRIEFLKKMREEKKFENLDELAKQITRDCVEAKGYHRKNLYS
jgi:riboflavin kinase/FMN adenylyltransferase